MPLHKQRLLRIPPYFSFKLGRCRFVPGLASTVVVLFFVPIFLLLGLWQWQRFQNKNATAYNQEMRKPLLTSLKANIVQKEGAMQDQQGRSLRSEGQFINQHTILLDNQIFKGQVGYKVLTPLSIQRQPDPEHTMSFDPEHTIDPEQTISSDPKQSLSSTRLLIDRGWIPLGPSRATLPTIPPIQGTVRIQGRLYRPIQGLKLAASKPAPNNGRKHSIETLGPLRVLNMDLKELEQRLGYTLYPLLLRLEPGDALGFTLLPFEAHGGIPASKHLGYALQWFMMALAVFIYYGVINTSCIKNHT